MIWRLQSLPFPIKIPSKFQAFFNTPSQISFFRFLMLSDAKMLDFGTPLAPGSAQNDGRNYPSVAKNGFRKLLGELLLADLLSRSLSDSSRSPMWLVLDAFGMDFGWILDGFLMDFGWILTQLFRILFALLQQHLQNANAALARNELTENVKNMQMYAETCKNKTQTKTHE